jgi:hypothetical protein
VLNPNDLTSRGVSEIESSPIGCGLEEHVPALRDDLVTDVNVQKSFTAETGENISGR